MRRMRRRYILVFSAGSAALCLLAGLMYNLPPIHDRLAWRVDNLIVAIKRYFNPPEEVVFTPEQQVELIVKATLTAMAGTPTPSPQPALSATPSLTPFPSLTPTAIPAQVKLNGIRHEYQQFNNC